MNCKKPGIQLFVPGRYGLAGAILVYLLLSGCANPPKAVNPSAETLSTGENSANRQQAAPPEANAPPNRMETSATGGEPAMTFEKTTHDFGDIGPQSRNTYEFRFKNTGTGVLKVREKIDSTCGCTVPVLSKTDYAPGEEGVIRVTYLASASAGSAAKSITVYSNDKGHGARVTLTIKATVVEKEKVDSEDQKSFRYRLRLSIKPPALSGTQRAFEDILAIHLTGGNTLPLSCHVFYGGPRVPLTDVRVRNR